MSLLRSCGIVMLCGVLLALPFRCGQAWPVWCALAPVLRVVLAVRSDKRALGHALLFALCWTGCGLSFLGGISLPGMAAASLYTSAYYVLGLMLIRRVARRGLWSAVWGSAAVWVLIELSRVCVPVLGFPWLLLGHACLGYPNLRQIADLAGVFGLSFLIAAVNAALAFALPECLSRAISGQAIRKTAGPGALLAGLLCGAWVYGAVRSGQIERELRPGEPLAVIQGNVVQKLDRSQAEMSAQLERHLQLQRQAADEAVRSGNAPVLICWAETMVPGYLNTGPDALRFRRDVRRCGVPVLCGSSFMLSPDADARDFNAAFLLAADGQDVCRYFKRRLVPFGEYVPFIDVFPVLRRLRSVTRDQYEPGAAPSPVCGIGRYRAGLNICVEDVYPNLARECVRNGANCLINLTNDGWFYGSYGARAHLQSAAWRAIEVRRPMLRVTNTGCSAAIDPLGRVELLVPEETEGVAVTKLLLVQEDGAAERTLYSLLGEDGCALAMAGVLALLFLGERGGAGLRISFFV